MTFLTRMLQQIKSALGVKPKQVETPPPFTRRQIRWLMNLFKEAAHQDGETLQRSVKRVLNKLYENSPEK